MRRLPPVALAVLLLGCGRASKPPRPAQQPPQRIVSMGPTLTEILFAVGAGDRLVGVTTYCNYPPQAAKIARIGGYMNPDMEVLLGLKPDLVVVAAEGTTQPFAEALGRAGVRVEPVAANRLDDVLAAVRHLGRVVGCEREADELADALSARAEKVRSACSALPKVKVLLTYGLRTQIVVAGKGSFGDDLIRAAGGINVAADSLKRYPVYNIEEIIRRAPEVILQTSMHGAETSTAAWQRWQAIPAVKAGRVVAIDGDLITRAGPRLFDALEQVARILHPHQFPAGQQR